MVFSSLLFLFYFLPIFLLAYYLTPARLRNITALIGSLVFYAWGAPRFLLMLLAISWVDLTFSRAIFHTPMGSRKRRLLLGGAISLNLLLLFYFKYSNFLVHECNRLLASLQMQPIPWTEVLLPIGVSFVVFEEISYLIDVSRGTTQPARSYGVYALFLFLFPHSIAGPIFRWHDLEPQLYHRTLRAEVIFDGLMRFALGLGKKVLVANQAALVADRVFAHELGTLPTSYAWIGIVAYSLQIYFDFSGYSDMAIGLGKMLGFDFKENFNAPYIAVSITDFWRRWHISLSRWMRDYLYIPLGGNRVPTNKQYRNLWVVFLASGIWHGASWTFLVWGIYHGTLLVIDRVFWERVVVSRLPRPLNIAFTFLAVMIGWVLFRSDSITNAFVFLQKMFGLLATPPGRSTIVSWGELLSNRSLVCLAAGLAFSFMPAIVPCQLSVQWFKGEVGKQNLGSIAARYSGALALMLLSTLYLVNSRYNPFIYFRF